VFFHLVHVLFASVGFAWPCILYDAQQTRKYILYVWWVCWITLHNVNSIVMLFVWFVTECVVREHGAWLRRSWQVIVLQVHHDCIKSNYASQREQFCSKVSLPEISYFSSDL